MKLRHAIWLTLALTIWSLAPLPAQQGRPAPQAKPGPASVTGSAEGVDILTAQVLLDRAGFSPGEIDGREGPNLSRAVAAFQSAHKLAASGALDAQTLTQLSGTDAQPALTAYTLTDSDVAGPFTARIPADLMQQSKLDALGYTSALEELAERFHASPALLRTLNPGASFTKAGEQVMVTNVPVVEPPPPPEPVTQGRGTAADPETANEAAKPPVTIVVTKATSSLTVQDEAGAVVFHAPVTSGSRRDPLPVGTWKVNGVQQNPPFHYNPALFWDADPSHSKAKIAPGPNNPVGTVWIDISKEHYGLHGTPEPARVGHAQSHGCVRLTNWDAQRVAAFVRPGTRVIFK